MTMILKILISASSSDLSTVNPSVVESKVAKSDQGILDHCSIIKLPPAILYFWVEFPQLMETVRVKQLGRTDQ